MSYQQVGALRASKVYDGDDTRLDLHDFTRASEGNNPRAIGDTTPAGPFL